jgi:hypothetical protein
MLMVIHLVLNTVDNYKKKGGVCIFVHKNLNSLNINLGKYCEDKDIEACSLKLESTCLVFV